MKRGGPLRRKTPLKRGGSLRRTGFKRRTDEEAKAKREARHDRNFGELAPFVRELGCCICKERGQRQETPTQAAHVRSRGAGNGAWLDNGDGNLLPMCKKHHDLQHAKGWTALFGGDRYSAREEAQLRACAVGESFRVKKSDDR